MERFHPDVGSLILADEPWAAVETLCSISFPASREGAGALGAIGSLSAGALGAIGSNGGMAPTFGAEGDEQDPASPALLPPGHPDG